MGSPPGDEGRWPALDAARLTGMVVSPAGLWREVRVVGETGSTNADLLARARSGAGEGLVLVAEEQTAGRGRMGRRWISPPRSASHLLGAAAARRRPARLLGWLPLLAGVAAATAVAETAGVDAALKWPNDVLVQEDKLAGILVESSGAAIVVGTGINVFQRRDELPVPAATSLLLAAPQAAGADARERVLVAVLAQLSRWYGAWLGQAQPGDADGCGLREEYLRRCATVGRKVTVMLPGGQDLTGTAAGVDAAGQLEVSTGSGLALISAGDVVHLR